MSSSPSSARSPESATTSDDGAEAWLTEHASGVAVGDALAFFDGLPAVGVAHLTGRWRGSGLATGSPLDGLLETYGWYGKQFVDADTAHPLLFADRAGRPRPVNPAFVPVSVLLIRPGLARSPVVRRAFAGVRPLLATTRPKARLRAVEHRGVVTAAMIYDALPIIDVFRRVSAGTVLGLMDLRGLGAPFFFLLRRE